MYDCPSFRGLVRLFGGSIEKVGHPLIGQRVKSKGASCAMGAKKAFWANVR